VLRPGDAALGIEVGGAGSAGVLNISEAMVGYLSTVGNLIIGTQGDDGHAALGAGSVVVNAIDFGVLTSVPMAIFGTSVTVAAGAGTLQAAAGITLDGRDGIVVHDNIDSSAGAGDIVLYSANGGISMDGGSALKGSARIEIDAAASLNIGQLDGASVVLRSQGGTISAASGDSGVNIIAETVAIFGYGPKIGTGDAIEVQAPSIFVSAPSGMVLQDTGPDGRTHFYVLDGATLYEQVIGFGDVVRYTEDPTPTPAPTTTPVTFTQLLTPDALFGATVPAFNSTFISSFGAMSGSDSGSGTQEGSRVASYLGSVTVANSLGSNGALAAGSQGMGNLSGNSLTLGSPGLQSLSTGVAASDTVMFDYWLEDLMV
jgi:hypothetical protein